jgi:LytS/YehU family sensor histidine kinase
MRSYVTVSTKVRREVVERAGELGVNIPEFLRRELEKEVELINRRLDPLKDVLDAIDVERVVRHIGEDRERRSG